MGAILGGVLGCSGDMGASLAPPGWWPGGVTVSGIPGADLSIQGSFGCQLVTWSTSFVADLIGLAFTHQLAAGMAGLTGRRCTPDT